MLHQINGPTAGCQGQGCNQSHCSQQASADESRRQFLARATTLAIGSLSLTLLGGWLPTPAGSATPTPGTGDVPSPQPSPQPPVFGFLVDTEKCIGAGKCLTACRIENDVPEGQNRTWVERYVHYKDGRVQVDLVPETGYSGSNLPAINPDEVLRAYFVPKLCNQCEEAPCNQVCPVHAAYTSPEGIELVDPDRCIGCAYCVQACPYGARFINHQTGNADKCTWCYHRVMRNEQPACVEACPVGARLFGRVDDPESEISKRLAQVPTSVLKGHLGTHPRLRYIDKSEEVI